MKSDYIVYIALGAAVLILGFTVWNMPSGGNNANADNFAGSSFQMKTAGTTSAGDVQIDLTPKGIVAGKFTVGFAANTHSVSMENFDLRKITTLEYNGKSYSPTAAPQLSGHHNSGSLVFDLSETPKKFKITISGIPNTEERVFEWK